MPTSGHARAIGLQLSLAALPLPTGLASQRGIGKSGRVIADTVADPWRQQDARR